MKAQHGESLRRNKIRCGLRAGLHTRCNFQRAILVCFDGAHHLLVHLNAGPILPPPPPRPPGCPSFRSFGRLAHVNVHSRHDVHYLPKQGALHVLDCVDRSCNLSKRRTSSDHMYHLLRLYLSPNRDQRVGFSRLEFVLSGQVCLDDSCSFRHARRCPSAVATASTGRRRLPRGGAFPAHIGYRFCEIAGRPTVPGGELAAAASSAVGLVRRGNEAVFVRVGEEHHLVHRTHLVVTFASDVLILRVGVCTSFLYSWLDIT